MAKQTSFVHQKNVLEQLLSLITEFDNDFKGIVQRYEDGLVSLYENEGLMDEIYEEYRDNYLNSMKASLSEILTRLQEEDIPFVEKEIDFMSSH
ncbi:MAG: hypothetical protein LBR13_01625 [Dysgonamonadaceae bacterium]|jgi:hypothetical protein|nr:hypothetical protein [Dysgonamonadaceae bacterium]